jgi:hypothetical protein
VPRPCDVVSCNGFLPVVAPRSAAAIPSSTAASFVSSACCTLSFGVVLKCQKRLDGQFYAVKKLNAPLANKPSALREVSAMAALQDSQHTVRYYNAWIEEGSLYIQMECMDYSLDKTTGIEQELTLATVLRHVLLGLVEIHSAGMAHLDIKVRTLCVCPPSHPAWPRSLRRSFHAHARLLFRAVSVGCWMTCAVVTSRCVGAVRPAGSLN